MGAAAPIIGLALSAVGTATSVASTLTSGGGTQYVPDSAAKYAADLEALKLAEYNAKQKESLIDQEKAAADAFALFSHKQQISNLQAEADLARMSLEQQWQLTNYNYKLNKEAANLEKFATKATYTAAAQQAELEYDNALRSLGLESLAGQRSLAYSNLDRQMKRQGYELTEGQQQFQYQQAQQQADITQAGLINKGTEINRQKQSIDLQEQQLGESERQAEQKARTAETGADVTISNALASVEMSRQQRVNELLNVFAGNERDFSKYQALLSSIGLTSPAGNVRFDQAVNPNIQAQQEEIRNQAGLQRSAAGQQRQLTQAQIDQQRAATLAEGQLQRQAYQIQRAAANLGLQGVDNEMELLRMQRLANTQAFSQQLQSLALARQALDAEQSYDVFSKQLLPDLKAEQLRQQYAQGRQQTLFGLGMNQYISEQADAVQQQQLDRAYQVDRDTLKSGLETLPSEYAYQRKSADAAYLSALGSADTQSESALAQLLASQSGLLSSLGSGLVNGYTKSSGGGGWAAGLSSIIGSVGGFLSDYQSYQNAQAQSRAYNNYYNADATTRNTQAVTSMPSGGLYQVR